MKKAFLLILAIAFAACSDEDAVPEYRADADQYLIPKVQHFESRSGAAFIWKAKTRIQADSNCLAEAQYLQDLIKQHSTFEPEIHASKGEVQLVISDEMEGPEEAYTLEIEAAKIVLKGKTKAGLMRAIQSLRQLMVDAFHDADKREAWALPTLYIADAPRFKHRGLLLDVCRHYFDKDVVKKYIDLLALYKMNVLHLHLTEDQGWRFESEAFPKLHQEAAYRREEDGSRYGGYFSKQDLRELVAFAEARHITIIPELELPGHSQAALSAYPQFSCLGADANIEVANDWGVFKEIYCAGNDSSFLFLESILEELMEIFPSEYIHIGGDEAPKFRWEHCAKCQKRMADEGLANEHELQSYFIKRIESYLNSKGRKLIGWDEILEGGLSPNATVQSWRGMEGGIAAARSQHQAIMSPTSHCYLDYGLHQIDLKKVYSFDPIPAELSEQEQKFIIGGECNMWTEHVPNEANLDSKVNPRMQALAEVLWTYPQKRDFRDFFQRMQKHYPMLESLGVAYGPEMIPAEIYADVNFDSAEVFIGSKTNFEAIDQEVYWNEKKGPWGFVLKESGTLKVQALKNEQPYGDTIEQEFEFHKALARKPQYQSEYSQWYTGGGAAALVNGRLGSLNFRDGQWQGFSGQDIELWLDLGELKEINSVSSNFYHYNNAWIFVPRSYKVYASQDGKSWRLIGESQAQIQAKQRGQHIEHLEVKSKTQTRFIKLVVESQGRVPDWHEAAGAEAWLFMDEIIVQ
ncbi:glycoside hydrolase family 20 protein [Croceimicrobium hydrocarbonivorans]|uniref:beta-N-acetylhexosaminidase n=1 Tax=Croceimicrobium hydrocarbonivorans TaxID=2761580 RepID=A0A7H0VJC5_9FLAO|nr:family 20 glycosylhydrolase [Croceimicrobium hydrocarbonivorans]QNR25823.1 family 20 glycosylhydrolase [Croceimicrobium hydrocarbonivorans]